MKYKKLFFLFILTIQFLIGCSSQKFNSENYTGKWKAEITMPGGSLPFDFVINKKGNGLSSSILNGEEKVNIKEVKSENDSLTLFLPAYNTKIRLKKDVKLKKLSGTLTLIKSGGIKQIMNVRAVKLKDENKTYKFSVNVSGRWQVNFVDDEGNKTISVGEFTQNNSKVIGTFLTTTGDYRYLNGFVKSNDLQLSTFDGAHVFLFKAKLKKDGKLYGDFWSGTQWHENWTGVRNEKAALPDEDSLTFLKKGHNRISFSLEDIYGNKVSLSDKKFKGKVVLVNLAGSWCPNCNDEARYLSEYYKKKKNKGLEIISLMFENYKDKNKNIRQIKRFRDKFDIKYDLLYAGINNKGVAAKLLPMLNTVLAFPTTIFIGRNGEVRKITTGFSGPGTGKHYIKFLEKFDLFVNHLLNEKIKK